MFPFFRLKLEFHFAAKEVVGFDQKFTELLIEGYLTAIERQF